MTLTDVGIAADVDISGELARRQVPAPDHLREKLAIQDLANRMASDAGHVLPRLTDLALQLCDADSSGVSVLEGDEFRWQGLSGRLAVFEGSRTPLNYSPCGVCLDRQAPTLMAHPERVYSWIADANITVPEVLLVPLLRSDARLGTIWVVARDGQQLHAGHARLMSELAVFTSAALQMVQADEAIKAAMSKERMFAREMSHRVKNFFAVTNSLVRMTARHAASKEEMVENLLGRLAALSDAHALAQDHHTADDQETVPLRTVVETVLRPYRKPVVQGPDIELTPSATSSLTLILHELATNAAKYGALSSPGGSLTVAWEMASEQLLLNWIEKTGTQIGSPPEKMGFGTTLIRSIITGLGGSIENNWKAEGRSVRILLPRSCLAE